MSRPRTAALRVTWFAVACLGLGSACGAGPTRVLYEVRSTPSADAAAAVATSAMPSGERPSRAASTSPSRAAADPSVDPAPIPRQIDRFRSGGHPIPVLIVASRDALEAAHPDVWDRSWGTRDDDSRIDRAIVWWELLDSGAVRRHPAVRRFAALANVSSSDALGEDSWSRTINAMSASFVATSAYTLLIAETVEHLAVADHLEAAIGDVGRGVFDVAKLRARKRPQQWDKDTVDQLDATLSKGRFWLLGRYDDLALILPRRIASRVRLEHLKTLGAKGLPEHREPRPSIPESSRRLGIEDCSQRPHVQSARESAAVVLVGLVHQRGAVYEPRLMDRGYRAFDAGDAILNARDCSGVELAILHYQEAEQLFTRALERAFAIRHARPMIRVH